MNLRSILYISYDGALDPLGSAQIIPYIINLADKGAKFTLLTFEKKEKLKNINNVTELKNILKAKNIKWEILRYHKKPLSIATFIDIFCGIAASFVFILRDKIKLIHARSFIGAIPALHLSKLFCLGFIYDMRGFWPDERIEGDMWKRKGFLYKIAKWYEKQFLLHANWIVCLTQEAKKIIEETTYLKEKKAPINVIPTCADIENFRIRQKDIGLLRRFKLEDRFIFLYFGSLGTWYMLDEMINFFKIAKQKKSESFFLILTQQDKKFVKKRMNEFEVSPKDFYIDYVKYQEVPKWLSIADCMIFFIKPTYSKKSSCPTKFGESLACGLPCIINSGIGDCDEIVKKHRVGVVMDRFSLDAYEKSILELQALLREKEGLRYRCRKVAEKYFSLSNAVEMYRQIYNHINMKG